MTPCRVVGLGIEALLSKMMEVDLTCVEHSGCSKVELWNAQRLSNGVWSKCGTHEVPLLIPHQMLALYILHRLTSWISGLGLCVVDAIVAKTRLEGTGHHDIKLGHASLTVTRYCTGFVSSELKVAHVGVNGRAFGSAWENSKTRCVDAMSRVLTCRGSKYGAAMLILVGICDTEDLLRRDPPLLVKAQLLNTDGLGNCKWGNVVLERGLVPVEPTPPPAKRLRRGRSWDEVRASLQGKELLIDGIERLRLLDLYTAIECASKTPSQKLVTYSKDTCIRLREGVDYFQMWYPSPARGKPPYWIGWDAALKIYNYEVLGRAR